jgi:hypothetical protein
MIGMAAVTTVGTTIGIAGGVGWIATQLGKFFSWAKRMVTDDTTGKIHAGSLKEKATMIILKMKMDKVNFIPEEEAMTAFENATQHKHFECYLRKITPFKWGMFEQAVKNVKRYMDESKMDATRTEKEVNPA